MLCAQPIRIPLAALLCWLAACAAAAEPWIRHTIDATSRGADGVRLADANGDGHLDIATAWEEGGVVRVYLHPGTEAVRRPWPAVTVGTVADGEDAVFADLDNDGALDVVSSCEGETRTVYVHWAPAEAAAYLDAAAWKTEAIPATQGVAQWMFALPMDVDADGDEDLVLGAKGSDAAVGWLVRPPNPRDLDAWTWQPQHDAAWIMSLRAVDVDADARPDIVASERRGAGRGVYWMRNPGAAEAPWPVARMGPAGEAEMMFCWAGRPTPPDPLQIVVGGKAERRLFRYTRLRDGDWHRHTAEAPPDTGTPKGMAVADIDRDGRAEVVMSCEHAFRKRGIVALDLETLAFDFDIAGREGIKFDRVELVDLDGDGDLDVLTCEETRGLGVIWYENPGG